MKELIIRCSSLGRLMADDKGSTITAKQLETLNGLKNKIKLTEKQAELRDALELKLNAKPELSIGAKSFIKEIVLFDKYGIRQEINNKYLDKGLEVEDLSIELASIVLDTGFLMKNDERFTNEYLTGEPDVLEPLIDVKSSWSAATFPFFDDTLKNKLYEWQLKGYMMLTGKKEAWLVYALINTPMQLVEDEMRRVSWKRGELGEVSEEVEREVLSFHTFDDIPVEKRVKAFKVEYTEADEKKIIEKVELARKYYNSIYDSI